jgi:hypothetical protein
METTVQTSAHPVQAVPPRDLAREMFVADLQAEIQAADARHGSAAAAARARIAAGESAFVVHRDKILGHHSTALRLQALVLNLYNGGDWRKKLPVPLDNLVANADRETFEAVLDLLRGYFDSGENDLEFLALGRMLAEQRLPRERRPA